MSLISFRIYQFIKYWVSSKNAHGLHSPFLFNFFNEVIKKKSVPTRELVAARDALKRDKRLIKYIDPKSSALVNKTASDIANTSLSSLQFNQFLSKLINWQKYARFLETGTALGYNSLFLSRTTEAKIHKIERAESLCYYAKEFHKHHSGEHIEIIHGKVQDVFKKQLTLIKPDIVFLDADHRSKTILTQIEIIKKTTMPKCIIIHDIYWSSDMFSMWKKLIVDPKFILTIDIFQAGIIFPSYPGVKQHFHIRF